MVLIISSVSGIVNVMCLVMLAAVYLLVLGSLSAVIIGLGVLSEVHIKTR